MSDEQVKAVRDILTQHVGIMKQLTKALNLLNEANHVVARKTEHLEKRISKLESEVALRPAPTPVKKDEYPDKFGYEPDVY